MKTGYYNIRIKFNGKEKYICSFPKKDKDIIWFRKNFADVFVLKKICAYFLINEGYKFSNDSEFEKCVEKVSIDEWKDIFLRNIKILKKAKMGHGSKYGEWFLKELISNGIEDNTNIYDKVENINNKILAINNGIKVKSQVVPVCIDGKIYGSMGEYSRKKGVPFGTIGTRRRINKEKNKYSNEEIYNIEKKFFGAKKKVFFNEKWYNSVGELLNEYGFNLKTYGGKKAKMQKKYGIEFSPSEVVSEMLKYRKRKNCRYVVNGIDYFTIDNLSEKLNLKKNSISSQRKRLQKKYNRPVSYEETVNYMLDYRSKKLQKIS